MTERKLLVSRLQSARGHVLGAVDGLAEADLRRSILPSGWSCVAMIQHLSLDVEHFWFACVVAGDETEIGALDTTGDAWSVAAGVTASAVLDDYRRRAEEADAIVAATSLDAAPRWWPEDLFGGWRLHTLGEILVHVLVETATHAGHLDAARELIDGQQWLVLDR